jgi:hypothetical protein
MNLNRKYEWLFVIAFVFFMFYKPIFCFLLLGTLIILYVIQYSLFLNNVNKNGKEGNGKILSYEIEDEGYKSPLVEFEINGKKIIKKPYYYSSTDLSKFKTYRNNIDMSIPIIYIPNDPEKFIIKSEKNFNYFTLILFTIVGLIFLLIGFAQLFNFIKIDGLN